MSAREAYPRRAKHNTVAEGGNRGWADPMAFRRPAKEAAPDMQGKATLSGQTALRLPSSLRARGACENGAGDRLTPQ